MSLFVVKAEGSSAGVPSNPEFFLVFTFFGPMVGRRRWGVRVESSPEPGGRMRRRRRRRRRRRKKRRRRRMRTF